MRVTHLIDDSKSAFADFGSHVQAIVGNETNVGECKIGCDRVNAYHPGWDACAVTYVCGL